MNKKKIIIVLSLVIVIASVIIGFMLMNHEEHTDEVKKYEVVEDEKVHLNVIDEISVPKVKADYLEKTPLKSIKKDLSMQYILNIIKDYDKTFKEKDYTLLFNGTMSFYLALYYKIDGIIETNKHYTVFVKDNKVDYIEIDGVDDKEKLANLTNINKDELLKLVSNFKGDYKAKKIFESKKSLFKTDKVLKRDGTLDVDNMTVNVEKIDEKFYYDFNDEKLYYEASMIAKYDDVYGDTGIEIVLN